MDNCAWCGGEGRIGWGEYYSIDCDDCDDKHMLFMWCSRSCLEMTLDWLRRHPRAGRFHKPHSDGICLGEFYRKDFPLSKHKDARARERV